MLLCYRKGTGWTTHPFTSARAIELATRCLACGWCPAPYRMGDTVQRLWAPLLAWAGWRCGCAQCSAVGEMMVRW
jgi:hypothetical protein